MNNKPVRVIAMINSLGYIGKNGQLMYQLPEDMRRFKELTRDHLLIMGRKTFESLPRVLPGRDHHVITSNPAAVMIPDSNEEDVIEYHSSFGAALKECRAIAAAEPAIKGIAVIGGREVFRQGLLVADEFHLTIVRDDAIGDVQFPANVITTEEFDDIVGGKMADGGFETEYTHYQRREAKEQLEKSGFFEVPGRQPALVRLSDVALMTAAKERVLVLIVAGQEVKFVFDTETERDAARDALRRALSAPPS